MSSRPSLPCLAATAIAALVLVGCAAVGPDYAGPPTAAAPARAFARATPAEAGAPLDAWWSGLGDARLDALVQRAISANPSVAIAEARLRHARAGLRLERENGAPKGGATALAARARIPPISLGGSDSGGGATNLTLYSVGFDATWEVDLFGGQRRAVEAAAASLEAAQANLADAQVSLSAEVAQAYVQLRDSQNRLRLNAGAIERQQRTLELTQQRVRGGTASRLDIARLQAQLESTRADALPLDAQREASLDELATLVGAAPGALDAELAEAGPVPLPPAQVSVGDPRTLLARRPDVRAAERTLATRSAQIGQAEAARYPKLSLLGLIGLGGTSLADLTHLDDLTAVAAPELSWNFADFGRAKTKVEEARADRDEAEAHWRQTVDGALRDAEDALSRYRHRRAAVATLARAKAAADDASTLMGERRRAGTASLIDLLDAERQQIAAEQSLSQAEAGMTTDFVSLQKALGLGWGAGAPAPTRDTSS